MAPARWSTLFIAMLAAMSLVPVAAAAEPPERVTVCHFTSGEAPAERQWHPIQISSRALEQHLADGDVLPGGTVSGLGDGAVFDENCLVENPNELPPPDELPPPPPGEEPPGEEPPGEEPPGEEPPGEEPPGEEPPGEEPPGEEPPGEEQPPPDSGPSELTFAVAYSDTDPGDGGYNPEVDLLIAKLVDGPGDAADGLPGAGDLVITHQYPMDFGPTAFGEFAVTEHLVTEVNLLPVSYACNVDIAGGIVVWSSGDGQMDLYTEFEGVTPRVRIVDGKGSEFDTLDIQASSPSHPIDAVTATTTWDPADQAFIDVEADCSG